MCVSKASLLACYRDAEKYIHTMATNWFLLDRSSCRFEMVFELDDVPKVIYARDYINVQNVQKILADNPLLIPVNDVISCIKKCGTALTSELEELWKQYRCTGNLNAFWRTYQLELALEKMLWGETTVL